VSFDIRRGNANTVFTRGFKTAIANIDLKFFSNKRMQVSITRTFDVYMFYKRNLLRLIAIYSERKLTIVL